MASYSARSSARLSFTPSHSLKADLQHWNNALADKIYRTQQLLQLADQLSDTGKVSALSRAKKRLRTAHRARKAYTNKTRLVGNSAERRVHREKLSQLSKELIACKNELNASIEALSSKYSRNLIGNEAGNVALQERQDSQDKMNAYVIHMLATTNDNEQTPMKQLFHKQEEIEVTHKVTPRVKDELNRSTCFIKKLRKRISIHQKSQINPAESCL